MLDKDIGKILEATFSSDADSRLKVKKTLYYLVFNNKSLVY